MFLFTTSRTAARERPVSMDILTQPMPDAYNDMMLWSSRSSVTLGLDTLAFSRDQERVLHEGHLAGTFSVRENHL